jgi:hypothetical protein
MVHVLYWLNNGLFSIWGLYLSIEEAKQAGKWILDLELSRHIHIQVGGRTIYLVEVEGAKWER